MATDPARVVAAVRRARVRNEVRKNVSPAAMQYQEMVYGHNVGPTLPRDPMQFLAGTFTPLSPIQPVPINTPDWDSDPDEGNRPGPRQREMPVGWNMPVGVPGSEGFKLASFGTLKMYADIYSVARSCIQLRKNEIRGLEWDVMPTQEAERRMRGDVAAHRDFAERRAKVVKFFRKPDPDYLSFGSYIDAVIEEILVTDALSLYIHPTKKKGAGPFGSDVAALEIISGSTIRPLVNTRGGRVMPPSPGYQQYLYGVPRVDLMEILAGKEEEQLKDLGKPDKEYRGDQLMYLPYTQRSWTPYGFPPLERTLIPTITGLRKQQFQMDFFDEGTIPGNYISPGEQLNWTPNQLQIWQNQNNALAGDPAWKHKSIALPPGSKVFPMKPIEIADQSDEVIMTQVCMGYDVEPMELGVSPKVSATQSTGAANQMAKASQDKQQRKSTKPTLSFLTDIFNVLIQVVWGQDDMRFFFEGLEEDEDENSLIERLVQMIGIGLSSIDEARIALGKSPWGLPITSDPVFSSPTAGLIPLGSIDPTTGKPMGTPPPAPVGAPPGPGGGPPGAGGPPPGVGGAPGGPPKALPPGAAQKPGQPAAGSPGGAPAAPGAAPQAQGPDQRGRMPEPIKLGEDGQPIKPGAPGYDSQHPAPPPKLHPDDKVGQARQDAQEAHAGVQAQMHQDFAAGKPLEPPVRPPVQSEDTVPTGSKGPSSKAMLSELDALRRKTKAGFNPDNWHCKHLPALVVDHFQRLLKMVGPDDAARVTREFVIQCFGPPVLQAQLEKVLDTSAPLDSTDGKQGLAPMDYQGEQPVQQSYAYDRCDICGKRHRPPMCKHGEEVDSKPDNGATSDGGATKSVVLPKARGTATTALAWSGWRYDQQLTALYASRLRRALHDAVDVESLARDYLASQQVSKGILSNLAQQAWSWLTGQGVQAAIQAAINSVMQNLYAEGFAVGKESAREQLDSAYESKFWDDWKPGDVSAARLVAGNGLQELLDGYGIQTIKSVAQTRMKDLANALAEGFEEGDSADTIAKDIRQILITPQRAQMIAGTELARATVQASVKEYVKADQDAKAWSGTPDDRICPGCKKNVEAGYIPIGNAFPSGALWPPGHPECRCAPMPGKLPAAQSGVTPFPLTVVKSLILDEYLSSGLTVADFERAETTEQEHIVSGQFRVNSVSTDSDGIAHVNISPASNKMAEPKDGMPLSTDGFVAGGLAVRARDTGRVLMIQRAHDEDDPAGGKWEFPGGRPEDGESVEDAARREWAEETGLTLPAGASPVQATWEAGQYRGHVAAVDRESDVDLRQREPGSNPDDPDDDHFESLAWWDPAELKDNPAVRPELQEHPKRVRRALEAATGDDIGKSLLSSMASSLEVDPQTVFSQLSENYPPDSIAWVLRATWRGPYLVPWDKIDHDDMDEWAASHQPERVDHFARKIENGDDVNPVILVADPDGNYIDVDGHHRALAYHKLGRLVRAWVGQIGSAEDRHAMEETHLDQVHEGASKLNKASAGGHHIAGTPYTWHHGWVPIDPLANECHDGCGGHTKGGKYLPGHDAKHVSHLAAAVKNGEITHAEAHESLSHSPKLQDKLSSKVGGPPGAPGNIPASELPPLPGAAESAHPAPGEHLAVEEPDEGMQAPSGLVTTSSGHQVAIGVTPDGRNWSTVITTDGKGSMFAIEPHPEGKEGLRNAALRATYQGDGKVSVEARQPDGSWAPAGPMASASVSSLSGSNIKVYSLMGEQMKAAQDAEKASAPPPAPEPPELPEPAAEPAVTSVAGDHPVVIGKWNTKVKSHIDLENELETKDLPGQSGTANNASAYKKLVASRIASSMQADHKQMVAAAFAGDSPGTDSSMATYLDAAEHPENYTMRPSPHTYELSLAKKSESGYGEPLTTQALKEYAVAKLVQNWAGTSNDHSVKSLVAQQAAHDEFNLENVAPWNMDSTLKDSVDSSYADHGAVYREFVRAQYNLTQQDLKDRGITHVNVMRGMKWEYGSAPGWTAGAKSGSHVDAPPLRPMSSWTVNSSTASNFSNSGGKQPRVVIKATMPASAVLSWPQSGFGCLNEYEFVCLAGVGQVTISSATNVPTGGTVA